MGRGILLACHNRQILLMFLQGRLDLFCMLVKLGIIVKSLHHITTIIVFLRNIFITLGRPMWYGSTAGPLNNSREVDYIWLLPCHDFLDLLQIHTTGTVCGGACIFSQIKGIKWTIFLIPLIQSAPSIEIFTRFSSKFRHEEGVRHSLGSRCCGDHRRLLWISVSSSASWWWS